MAQSDDDWKVSADISIPDSVQVEKDISYLGEARKEKADLYLPSGPSDKNLRPVVLLIHGGGFNDGDKGRRREVQMAVELAAHGYACLSINYKLWNKGIRKPTWPQSLHDAKTAVRWLRVHSERLRLDPERIGAFGNSAGGNLALMLATTTPKDGLDPETPYNNIGTQVRCAIDFYGALDLINYHDMKMFQQTREENPEIYRKASPTTWASSDDAPVLIVHGDADETVHVSQAHAMATALRKANANVQLEIVPRAPHTFYLVSRAADFRPLVFDFLDRFLMHAKPGTN